MHRLRRLRRTKACQVYPKHVSGRKCTTTVGLYLKKIDREKELRIGLGQPACRDQLRAHPLPFKLGYTLRTSVHQVDQGDVMKWSRARLSSRLSVEGPGKEDANACLSRRQITEFPPRRSRREEKDPATAAPVCKQNSSSASDIGRIFHQQRHQKRDNVTPRYRSYRIRYNHETNSATTAGLLAPEGRSRASDHDSTYHERHLRMEEDCSTIILFDEPRHPSYGGGGGGGGACRSTWRDKMDLADSDLGSRRPSSDPNRKRDLRDQRPQRQKLMNSILSLDEPGISCCPRYADRDDRVGWMTPPHVTLQWRGERLQRQHDGRACLLETIPESPPPSESTSSAPETKFSGAVAASVKSFTPPAGNRRSRSGGATPKKLLRFAAVSAGCSLLGSPPQVKGLYNTSLTFDPPVAGYPCEITYAFTPQYSITEGKFIRLNLNGFTSGERNGSAGPDVGFESESDEGNGALVWPSDTFHGWWSEGTPEEEYADGLFNIYTVRALWAGTPYTAVIDRASSLKSNCGHAANNTGFFAWVDEVNTRTDDAIGYEEFGHTSYLVENVQEIPVDCYVSMTALTFKPPLPAMKTHITVIFQPARALVAGDNITINIKGFTSGDADGNPGKNFEVGDLIVSDNTSWLAGWQEGTYVRDEPGYEESRLLLRAKNGTKAGRVHRITVIRSNGLRAQCGMAENGSQSTISVVSASYPPWSTTEEFEFSQAIGPGCRELNYCSNRGRCDYCLQRCDCHAGFGAASDVFDRDVAADCSERMCPAGISWAPVLGGNPRPKPDESHTLAECSNMGVCVRSFGTCNCEEGFEGRACERYACPNDCSDRGACRNMREMGMMEKSTPLVNDEEIQGSSDGRNDFLVIYGWGAPAGTGTWESHSVYGCVCDSSWEVGLGSGQTQEAEFFGADCSLLHCPSGDDPETAMDETDCSNKTVPGGRGVGAKGNKCQVDCSNRGLCDHSTGICSCFDGYHGQACDLKQADGYGFNTDGV